MQRVVGIGIDLVETSRVEKALDRWGDRFVIKLMDVEEASHLPKGEARVRAMATAVAVKEAVSKALGTGWTHGVRWRDVVVMRHPSLEVRLENQAQTRARELGSSGRCHVSLEQEGLLVVAEAWLLS